MDWINLINKFISKISEGEVYQQKIIDGILTTLKVASCGLIIGFLIGTFIGIIKVMPKFSFDDTFYTKRDNFINAKLKGKIKIAVIILKELLIRALDIINTIYVALFRGTPIVVQLLLSYYVLLPTLGIRGIGEINVAIMVFGLNSGAYISEFVRSGIQSVDKGQLEASRALGLGYLTSMLKIVFPQAIKNIIPAIGNEYISLIKETSVLSFISIVDAYVAFQQIGGVLYNYMIPYICLALIYIFFVVVITLILRFIEKQLNRTHKIKRSKA